MLFLFLLLFFLAISSIRVVAEFERGVIFRLGRYAGTKGPGLFFILPGVDKMLKVDLRIVTLDVPTQEMMTRDNVPVKVNAVVYFRVLDPGSATIKVANYLLATSQYAQTTLRSVIGFHTLDEVLSEREKLNHQLQAEIDRATDPWGIKVTAVELKDVEIPDNLKRAMAKQAEAERERRAKIIAAEGEFQASEKMRQAADIMSGNPTTLQLRFLQTLVEIASEHNSTILFPVPIDLLAALTQKDEKRGG